MALEGPFVGVSKCAIRMPFVLSLVLTGLWCVATVVLVPPVYFTNDDLVLNLLSAGVGVTDVPDEHLLFTHIWIGKLLATLYGVLPSVPWYPLYLTVLTWLACAALLYVLLLRMPAAKAIGLFLAYLGLFGVMLFSRLQFTIVALHCGLAGLALLHHAWEQIGRPLRFRILHIGSGFALLILCGAIRIHIVAWVMLLAIPLLAASLWSSDAPRRQAAVAASMVCAILWSMVYLTDTMSYQRSPEWREFQEINSLRTSFNDYGQVNYTKEVESIFHAEGWDRLDFEMINEWFYADEKKYSVDNLQHIVGAFPAWKQEPDWSKVHGVVRWLVKQPLFSFTVVYITWLVYAVGVQARARGGLIGMLAIVLLALPVFYMFAKLPPPYLILPTLAFVAYWPLYWTSYKDGVPTDMKNAGGRITRIGAVIVAMAGIATYGTAVAETAGLSAMKEQVTGMLGASEVAPQKIYVVWGNSLPPASVPAYQWGDVLRRQKIVWIGASLHSPVTKRMLAKLHITDLYRALYERDDVFLINSKQSRERLLAEYVRSRHDVKIIFMSVKHGAGMTIVKAVKSSDASLAGPSG